MMSEAAEEQQELVLRDHLLVQADSTANLEYQVLIFLSDLGPGAVHAIPIILLTEVESKLLVAVPFNSWNRLVRLRLLPATALTKFCSVAVAAVESDHRDQAVDNIFIKVWIGFLNPAFEECVGWPEGEDVGLSAFPTEDDEEGFLPFATALLAVADEKFMFLSAESGPADGGQETRDQIAALESSLLDIRAALDKLTETKGIGRGKPVAPTAKAVPNARAVPLPSREDGIAGLDKGSVKAALQAGIEREQLEELATMIGPAGRGKMRDSPGLDPGARKMKLNVLGESEEEPEAVEHPLPLTEAEKKDPMLAAVTKLTAIVGSLASHKKRSKLEDTLDDTVLLQDGASSLSTSSSKRHSAIIQSLKKALRDHPEEIYAVMERRMLDDFGAPEESPGSPSRSGTFRGWAEHRSRIPNIPTTVRTVWGICGALDALRANKVSEAKARLILLLGQIDQLAVDRGQAILSSEGSLEDAPPFSSFGKHLPPDIDESQHTKLWPATWAEAFMWKIKELDDFVERRQKLGKRGQWTKPDTPPPGPPKPDPKKKGGKGGGKFGKNPESSSGAAEEAASSSNH